MSTRVFRSLLNHVFTVWVPERVFDGQGGWIVTYTDAGTVRGRLRPANASERVVADREEQQISHVLYTAALVTGAGVPFGRGALIVLEELQVEVLGVREPSRAGHHYEIDCLERQGDVALEEAGS